MRGREGEGEREGGAAHLYHSGDPSGGEGEGGERRGRGGWGTEGGAGTEGEEGGEQPAHLYRDGGQQGEVLCTCVCVRHVCVRNRERGEGCVRACVRACVCACMKCAVVNHVRYVCVCVCVCARARESNSPARG